MRYEQIGMLNLRPQEHLLRNVIFYLRVPEQYLYKSLKEISFKDMTYWAIFHATIEQLLLSETHMKHVLRIFCEKFPHEKSVRRFCNFLYTHMGIILRKFKEKLLAEISKTKDPKRICFYLFAGAFAYMPSPEHTSSKYFIRTIYKIRGLLLEVNMRVFPGRLHAFESCRWEIVSDELKVLESKRQLLRRIPLTALSSIIPRAKETLFQGRYKVLQGDPSKPLYLGEHTFLIIICSGKPTVI